MLVADPSSDAETKPWLNKRLEFISTYGQTSHPQSQQKRVFNEPERIMRASLILYVSFEAVRLPLTFRPLQQVDLQNRLGRGLSSSDQQPHHWPRLFQGLHCPAVHHFRHVHIVHAQHAVVHPGEGRILEPFPVHNFEQEARKESILRVIRNLQSTPKSTPYDHFLCIFQSLVLLQ